MTAYIGTGLKVSISTEMTTDELIARARALLEGVTPGPWVSEAHCVYHRDGRGLVASLKSHEWGRDWPTTERDRDFIAASRQLVPDLIAALRAAEARAERAEALIAAAYRDSALVIALRPFDACMFNDNGDVTISTGDLLRRDWLRLRAALRDLDADQ